MNMFLILRPENLSKQKTKKLARLKIISLFFIIIPSYEFREHFNSFSL